MIIFRYYVANNPRGRSPYNTRKNEYQLGGEGYAPNRRGQLAIWSRLAKWENAASVGPSKKSNKKDV
jgi:hypothetical protein